MRGLLIIYNYVTDITNDSPKIFRIVKVALDCIAIKHTLRTAYHMNYFVSGVPVGIPVRGVVMS